MRKTKKDKMDCLRRMETAMSDLELRYHLPDIKVKKETKMKEGYFTPQTECHLLVCGERRSDFNFTCFALAACYLGYVEAKSKGIGVVKVPLSKVDRLDRFIAAMDRSEDLLYSKVIAEIQRLEAIDGADSDDKAVNGKDRSSAPRSKFITFDLKGVSLDTFRMKLMQSMGLAF